MIYIFSNDKNLHEIFNEMDNVKLRFHNLLIWKKNNCTPSHWYMKSCEFIVYGYKGKAIPIKDIGALQCIEIPNLYFKDKQHPVQKPVSLLSILIENSCDENGVILDPFIGAGSTAVASKKLNRKCIGIEIEEKYCEIAAKRCSQEVFDFGPGGVHLIIQDLTNKLPEK